VRRRADLGGVAGTAGGIGPDLAVPEEGPEGERQLAGGAIVGGDDQRRAVFQAAVVFQEPGQQGGPERQGNPGLDPLAPVCGIANPSREPRYPGVIEKEIDGWTK